jgi:hypothetical protein
MAKEIEGHWDTVLPLCYPFFRDGTHVDPAAVSPDGKTLVLVPGMSGSIDVWDMVNGSRRRLAVDGSYYDPKMCPNTTLLAVKEMEIAVSTKTATIWEQFIDWLASFASTPDTPLVSHKLVLLDTATQHLHTFCEGRGASFSPDGTKIAVLYADKTEIWRLPILQAWNVLPLAFVVGFCWGVAFVLLVRRIRAVC